MNPVLQVHGLEVRYGQLTALRDVSFTLTPGQRLFVVGANGAGKSTLLRTIAGALRPHAGEVRIDGANTQGLPPDAVVRRGYTMVPESRDIFATLTVKENLLVGAHLAPDAARIREDLDFVLEMLPDLRPRLAVAGGVLSGGQQQMLAIGRALMTRSRIVALDEPSLGLAPKVIDTVYAALTALQRRRPLALLIAEQSYARALTLDAELHVLRSGRIVCSGAARALHAGGALEQAYFGFAREAA